MLSHRSEALGLKTIALYEFLKGLIVLLAVLGVFAYFHKDVQDLANELGRYLELHPHAFYRKWTGDLVDQATSLHVSTLLIIGLAYSALRFVEAYGLWKERIWAEWLAIFSGAVYLPVEVYEWMKSHTATRALIFLANLAVVTFLVVTRIQRDRRAN